MIEDGSSLIEDKPVRKKRGQVIRGRGRGIRLPRQPRVRLAGGLGKGRGRRKIMSNVSNENL